MTTTAPHPDLSKALALLATGHTVNEAADIINWPASSVRALVNGQKGWLVDDKGRVYDPSQAGYRVRLPDGATPVDVAWAQRLLAEAPKPAVPKPPVKPAEPRKPTTTPAEPVKGSAAIDGPLTTELPTNVIHGHAGNIRDELGDLQELAASIRAHGILQPLTVHPHPAARGQYQILAGHRRHAAALLAGLTKVPVVIRSGIDGGAAIEVMLVENVQRRDLNPMEKAEALGKLRALGYSNALISTRTGIASSTVSYLLALLELDLSTRERVRAGEITAGEAVAGVREMRKKRRGNSDTVVKPWSWEPDYLTKTHPQARAAERLCDARQHTARRRIGKVACGQCWETVIRQDERVVERVVVAEHPESGGVDRPAHALKGIQ